MEKLSAKQIKKIAQDNGVEKIDCRLNFFHIRDDQGVLRLGFIYRGIDQETLLRNFEATKIHGSKIN